MSRRKPWGALPLLAGIVLLMHGCTVFLRGGGHVFGAEQAEGLIVEERSKISNSRRLGTTRVTVIEYTVPDGRTFRVVHKTGDATLADGKRQTVYYDPAAPERGLVGGTAPLTVTPYLYECIAGWVLFGAGMAALIIFPLKRPRKGRG